MPTVETTDYAWLHAALVFGLSMSKDPNRKVGACVVAPNRRAVSFGYNGLVAGVEESEENWSRPRKYGLVRHAELNAILNAPFDVSGSTLYSVLKPCHDCLGDAINAGVKRVVWLYDPVPFVMQDEQAWNVFAEMFDELIERPRIMQTEVIIASFSEKSMIVYDQPASVSMLHNMIERGLNLGDALSASTKAVEHMAQERAAGIQDIMTKFRVNYDKAAEIYDQHNAKENNDA